MNDSVKARLKRSQTGLDAKVTAQDALQQQTGAAMYSASYIPPVYAFSMPGAEKGFRFRLDSAEISSRITQNYFSFTFSVIGIPPVFTSDFSSLLTLVYADTTIYRSQTITENKTYSIPASKYITGDTLSQIYGFVHLQDSVGITPNIRLYNVFLGVEPAEPVVADSLQEVPEQMSDMDSLKIFPAQRNGTDSLK
jgi:hypothetical protein